jgi:hypothetical protein
MSVEGVVDLAHWRQARLASDAAAAARRLAGELGGADAVADRRLLESVGQLEADVERGELAELFRPEVEALVLSVERAIAERAAAAREAALAVPVAAPDDEVRAAAAALVSALAAAEAAQAAVGPRPPAVEAETVVAARRRCIDAEERLATATDVVRGLPTRVGGLVVSAAGLGAIGASSGSGRFGPVVLVLAVLLALRARAVWRGHRRSRARARADLAAAVADRELVEQAAAAGRAWRAAVAALADADATCQAANRAWQALAGPDADPERVDEVLARSARARRAAARQAEADAALVERMVEWRGMLATLGLPRSTSAAASLLALDGWCSAGAAAAARLAEVPAARERQQQRDQLRRLLADAASLGRLAPAVAPVHPLARRDQPALAPATSSSPPPTWTT